MYEKYIKRSVDLLLSLIGLIVLAVPMLITALIIFIDDPGPVIFKQKRIGIRKTYFNCYKFRSMKTSTPHDIPTHKLENSEQYITKFGRLIRKMSIDELPQIFNIIKGDMAIIGPRPALWNQDNLIKERDRYGANDILPGLTGWAQINGRDELDIPTKAKFDGIYTQTLNKGGLTAFTMDVRCFVWTFFSVLRHKGVVEGATERCVKKTEQERYL